MRALPTLLCALLLVACGTQDEEPAAEAGAETPSIADFAGTWSNVATLEGVDEPVPSTMSGSAAGDDWTMSLPDRENIPVRVHMQGDSLIAQSEQYESSCGTATWSTYGPRACCAMASWSATWSLRTERRTARSRSAVRCAVRAYSRRTPSREESGVGAPLSHC
jgi:hypothetical protein